MKSQRVPQIRIQGLVAVMNRIRRELADGIPPDQVQDFKDRVTRAVLRVESICSQRHSRPERLPGPSFRAYSFLKDLNLAQLPLRDPNLLPNHHEIRVANLVKRSNDVRRELLSIATGASQGRLRIALEEPAIASVMSVVHSLSMQVEKIADATHSHASQLPLQSRQAYQWVKFLTDPDNLLDHLHAMDFVKRQLDALDSKRSPTHKTRQAVIDFYGIESLWRKKVKDGVIQLTASEGFIRAQAPVLEALVRLGSSYTSRKPRAALKEYADGDEFADLLTALTLPTAEVSPNLRGRCRDLAQVFERVNASYFESRLDPPHLVWNKTVTYRKMGHYERSTDTVMISIALDDPAVPEWAIDLVMYHELLHRVLGFQVKNGQRYAHTTAFRTEEKKFQNFQQADAFIDNLARGLESPKERRG